MSLRKLILPLKGSCSQSKLPISIKGQEGAVFDVVVCFK